MRLSLLVGSALCGALAFASLAATQLPTRRTPGPPSGDDVGVAIALQVGGDTYQFTGRASCTHEAKGHIYSIPAQQWRVEHRDGTRSIALTFWRPASGSGEMFTLYLQAGGRTYAGSTVKTPRSGSPEGAGEVILARAGASGIFMVDATAANGARITGTIRCDAFGRQ